MERASSVVISSNGLPSTTSGTAHRRNTSSAKNGVKPAGTTAVSLFVTNLRLLNFDLLSDWPNITVSSLGSQDARTKIKCTEYALYQLFRLYDPATTADKLQPFFPPLEPLQSVNLRAALFRCLNELKKSGVLPKETVLRKTMLDECQGEKFWEVCLSLSFVVLRRQTQKKEKRRSQYDSRPVAERLGTAQSLGRGQRDSMLPLAIAHKAALHKVLDEKQGKRETYARLYDILAEKEDELRERKTSTQNVAQRAKAVSPEKLKSVEKAVEKNWIGSTDLKDALVDGDTCPKGDAMLLQPFDKLWKAGGQNEVLEAPGAEVGLLQSLNEKAAQQTARLRKWQNFHDRLIASKPPSVRSSRPTSVSQKGATTFNKHRDINFHEPLVTGIKQTPQKQAFHNRATSYDEILTAMREELRKNSANHSQPESTTQPSYGPPERAQTQLIPVRKPSIALDTSAGAQSHHTRSPSQTAVPMRSPMGRRAASRSKSYEKPKVVSQREHIPLKSELFSPLKDKRRNSTSPLSESMLPSPVEEASSSSADLEDVGGAGEDSVKEDSMKSPTSPRDSGLGLNAVTLSKSPSKSDDEQSESKPEVEFKMPALPTLKSRGGGATTRPSLAERTRQSMAFTSSEDLNGFLPEPPATAPANIESLDKSSIAADSAQDFDRPASLLDRTRQSISMMAPESPRSKKPSHIRSRTSAYPINQFDTPKKGARPSTVGMSDDLNRDITPVEQLFSPDAEYDSIFKARPKIAMSPVLTPHREVSDSFDGEIGRSSPLVGIGVGGRG